MEKNLKRWLQEGLIDEKTYLELLEDYKKQKEKRAKILNQITLYIIGAVLLGIGVILFISANDWLLELFNNCFLLKIVPMFLLTSGSLFFGYKLAYENKKMPRLGSALIFLSTMLIGGTYALIGQNYNTQANTSFLYILWLISVYPLSFIFKSNAINVLSIVLYIIASVMYYDNLPNHLHATEVFIPIVISSFLYLIGNIEKIKKDFYSFSLCYKTTSMVIIYITLLCSTFGCMSSEISYFAPYIIPIVLLIIFNGINLFSNKENSKISNFESIYFSLLMGFLLLLLSGSSNLKALCCLMAHGFIIALIYALYKFSHQLQNEKLKSLGTKFLTFYLIVNFLRFGEDYLEGGTLFIIGGLILFSLGFYFERKKRKK